MLPVTSTPVVGTNTGAIDVAQSHHSTMESDTAQGQCFGPAATLPREDTTRKPKEGVFSRLRELNILSEQL